MIFINAMVVIATFLGLISVTAYARARWQLAYYLAVLYIALIGTVLHFVLFEMSLPG